MRKQPNGGLRVVTLNIDWNKNLQRVLPFLSKTKADIVCLQEVREDALSTIAKVAGKHYFYVPMCGGKVHGAPGTVGIAIFSRFPLIAKQSHYYVGDPAHIVELDEQSLESRRATNYRALAIGEVQKGDRMYRVVTTHFTWTPDGKPDLFQRRDLLEVVRFLQHKGELLLCGDFNAPRGGEIYSEFSRHFRDSVPERYHTSIDPKRHRIKGLRAMVDGIFATPQYAVSQVAMHFGVSDHGALEAAVSRN